MSADGVANHFTSRANTVRNAAQPRSPITISEAGGPAFTFDPVDGYIWDRDETNDCGGLYGRSHPEQVHHAR